MSEQQFVFIDPISQHLLALAQRVAQADVTALLVGPTGSGKEVMARVLHEFSPRNKGPFVALNCATLPDHLIEDMLFGHDRGAFTGAIKEHQGVFEQAQGGTVFLDEIGEMPFHLQAKLLRVLQERQITRLGSHQTISLNVRIITATNKDLRQAILNREFREDLYYRIATFRLKLFSLRERPGDILPLAMHFLKRNDSQAMTWSIDLEAQNLLINYAWPGNVRELENVLRRAMVLCSERHIKKENLMFDEWPDSNLPVTQVSGIEPFEKTVSNDLYKANRENEHQLIMNTLANTRNRNEAAEKLGISPRTLRYKLAQFREMGFNLNAAA